MTDRVSSITVVIEKDMRIDDAQALLAAIRCMKSVISVEANISDPLAEHVASARVRRELAQGLYEVLWPEPKS